MPISKRTARIVAFVFFAVVLTKAGSYWVGSAILRPSDPLSTVVLYRGKDIQSFPIMGNLSHLGLGEPSLFEGHNAGVLSERYVPWALHAILLRLFGPAGFIVGDLIVTPLRYFLLSKLLMLCGVRRRLAQAVSAILTCAAIDNFGEWLSLFSSMPLRFWGLRIPRPYISEIFMLIALLGAVAALNRISRAERPKASAWAAVGAGEALLLQSDFYTGIGVGLGLAGLLMERVFNGSRRERPEVFRGFFIAAGCALPLLVPMVLQSLYLNPEGPVRLGLFPMSRLAPPFITEPVWLLALLFTVVVATALTRLRADATEDPCAPDRRNGRAVLIAVSFGALGAMPFMTAVTGQGIELYHFRDSYVRLFSLTVLLVGVHVLERVFLQIRKRMFSSTRPARNWAPLSVTSAVLVACLCGAFSLQWALRGPRNEAHARADFAEWGGLPDYRTAFVELAQSLSQSRFDGLVLGTFDTELWSWWVTFRGGYSFLADACTSNATNSELERRTAALGRSIGMTPDGFVAFARRPYVNIFWIGCDRYQASKAFTFAPLEDYDPDARAAIDKTTIFSSFSVSLPMREQARLRGVFEATGVSEVGRLDLIALTKDQSTLGLAPSTEEYSLLFENAVFRLWGKRARRP